MGLRDATDARALRGGDKVWRRARVSNCLLRAEIKRSSDMYLEYVIFRLEGCSSATVGYERSFWRVYAFIKRPIVRFTAWRDSNATTDLLKVESR